MMIFNTYDIYHVYITLCTRDTYFLLFLKYLLSSDTIIVVYTNYAITGGREEVAVFPLV